MSRVRKFYSLDGMRLLREEKLGVRSYVQRPRDEKAATAWSVMALLKAYSWPTLSPVKAGSAPRIIGILEMGGGWVASDIAAFLKGSGIPGTPKITDVSVDGTANTPTAGSDSPDLEVALDIEVAVASFYAAAGQLPDEVRVYWTQSIAEALAEAASDGCSVFSMSWGASESQWAAADMQTLESTAQAALAVGCTPVAAAGDNDADDDDGDGQPSVDCPASCPSVLACGGTSKPQTGAETVWNNNPGNPDGEGTGGGFSAAFPAQASQIGAPTPPAKLGRMVPDVAACADPDTGITIYVHGASVVVGGTSAVAPLWSGLIAAMGPNLKGVAAKLWENQGACVDVTSGNNGLYSAGPGPDACTGIGVPNGAKIAGLFAAVPVPAPTPPAPVPTPPAPSPTGGPTAAEVESAVTAALSPGMPFISRKVAISEAVAAIAKTFAMVRPAARRTPRQEPRMTGQIRSLTSGILHARTLLGLPLDDRQVKFMTRCRWAEVSGGAVTLTASGRSFLLTVSRRRHTSLTDAEWAVVERAVSTMRETA